MPSPANDNSIIVSLNQVCAMTSLSRTAVNKRRRDGVFPLPVELGERRIGFVKTEILAWIDERVAARVAA